MSLLASVLNTDSSYFSKHSLINCQNFLAILLLYRRELAKDKW